MARKKKEPVEAQEVDLAEVDPQAQYQAEVEAALRKIREKRGPGK